MSNTLSAQDLRPDRDDLAQETVNAFKGAVEESEVRRFLKEASTGPAPAINAKASLTLFIKGELTCEPLEDAWRQWKWDHTVWGGPACEVKSVAGFMYTAYGSWDTFFREVTGAQVTGGALHAGVLQINFLKGLLPIGQFNGMAVGDCAAIAGGDGAWERK